MVRKILLLLFTIFVIFSCCYSSFCYTYVDSYPISYVYQNGDSTSTGNFPSAPVGEYSFDYSKAFIINAYYLYIFVPYSNATGIDNYSGSFNLSRTPQNWAKFQNNTNIAYQIYQLGNNGWETKGVLNSGATYNNYLSTTFEDPLLRFCGADVLVQVDGGNYQYPNYDSRTLEITSSTADLQSGNMGYPVIFSNANLDIGLENHLAYVQVSIKKSGENDFTDGQYVILTNNEPLYNAQTSSFYVPMQHLIDTNLTSGDQFRLTYSWSVLDRLGNPHTYSFYDTYTRTADYDASGFVPAPVPGDTPDEPTTPDYTQNFDELNDSIQGTTNSINDLNDKMFSNDVNTPTSIDIQDNVVDNSADLSNIFSSIYTAFTTRDNSEKSFPLTLPNGDTFYIVFPSSFIVDFLSNYPALLALWSSFWYIAFGSYVIFDFKKIFNKFKNGDFESAMNSSPIDNIVKESLR